MPDTLKNRREVLKKLIEQYDGPAALARKLGYKNSSFLIQMAGPNPTRDVTEKTARSLEKQLDLPVGFMDGPVPHDTPAVDVAVVTNVVRMVAQTCEDEGLRLEPEKFADLVALVYADTLETKSDPRPSFIRKLLKLLR